MTTQIDIKGLKKLYIDLNESVYRATGQHGVQPCNHCNARLTQMIYARNKTLILFGKVFPLNIQTAKDWKDVPIDQLMDYTIADVERWSCTEQEIQERLEPYCFFLDWAKEQVHHSKQKVHLMEAFEIFEEEVYDICMSHLANPRAEEKVKDHFKEVLQKFKAWKTKEDHLNVERAKEYPITSLVAQFISEEGVLVSIAMLNVYCMKTVQLA